MPPREFEPSAQAIRNWVRQATLDAGQRTDGPLPYERAELRRRRENRYLAEERLCSFLTPRDDSLHKSHRRCGDWTAVWTARMWMSCECVPGTTAKPAPTICGLSPHFRIER
jgi:hypothetical protein